ncbi:hypothetical protein [Rhizobium leguminosarum]|uniref:hypothetical protein n=1 Tax=Rhizobium leguminosarum TaxID=384 RepID=UPI0010390473|nr:hypothetical protein [Rhizobium leguminosarum]MBY5798972.1 hypothetical protein [Rhizobium leguminosarum]TBZ15819.1 hypothetical protein E0H33_12980 [Rhizobium leguminosarum bv. viciae]
MSTSGPSITDIKLLFAKSGNRCSFPKCKAPMALGDTLTGEVCHIKGARPGSARHDPNQLQTDRHLRENLILMCPTHHTIIDDDEGSYTVERLLQIKLAHEETATPVPDDEVARVAISLQQNVSTVGQTGGLSAHTVNAASITVQASGASNPLNERQIQAVENLWRILRNFSNEFSMVVFVDSILLPQEMGAYFNGADNMPVMDSVLEFRDLQAAIAKMAKAGGDAAAMERPFVSQRLWSIFYVIQAIYGRASFMLTSSYKEKQYVNWRNDSGCDQLLRAVLPAIAVDHLKSLQSNALRTTIDSLEDQFLIEAGMRKASSV